MSLASLFLFTHLAKNRVQMNAARAILKTMIGGDIWNQIERHQIKSCQKLISKPVKRNVKSMFLRIFVSAVGLFGNLLWPLLALYYAILFETHKHNLCCRNTLEKQKWRLYFITRAVLDYGACNSQPLNRKLFPVLKYLLIIISVVW